MPLLIANRQLVGDFGDVQTGQTFQADEETALSLESRGLARRLAPPPPAKMMRAPQNKMFTPAENK